MKNKRILLIIPIAFFAISLLSILYLNALNCRYTILDSQDLLIMDNWTKRPYLLPQPKQLRWSYEGDGARVIE